MSATELLEATIAVFDAGSSKQVPVMITEATTEVVRGDLNRQLDMALQDLVAEWDGADVERLVVMRSIEGKVEHLLALASSLRALGLLDPEDEDS